MEIYFMGSPQLKLLHQVDATVLQISVFCWSKQVVLKGRENDSNFAAWLLAEA